MTVSITIYTSNAAFDNGAGTELALILRGLADRVKNDAANGVDPQVGDRLPLFDTNGNTVGAMEVN